MAVFGIAAEFAFRAQFVADFSAANQDALGGRDFAVRHHPLKSRPLKILDRRRRVGMPQHALRREHDHRLAPAPQRLPAQQLKILRGVRRLANLNVVLGRELKIALDPRAGMFGPLPFIPVRQKQPHARRQVPLVFRRADELVDDDLRAVGEIAELRFPQHQRFRIVAAVAVFKAEHARLRKASNCKFRSAPVRAPDVRAARTALRSAYRPAPRAAG